MAFFPEPKQPTNPEIRPKYILFRTTDSGTRGNLEAFKMSGTTGAVTVGSITSNAPTSTLGQIQQTFGLSWNDQKTQTTTNFDAPWSSDYAVIPWTAQASLIQNASTVTTQTQGGMCVERRKENGGFVSGEWNISGKIAPIPYRAADYETMSIYGPSKVPELPIAFQILHQAIDLVNEVAKDPSSRLVLYSLQEGEFWYVEPLRYARLRDSSLRTGYTYEFNFRLIQRAEPPIFSYVYDKTKQDQPWYQKLISTINKAIKLIANAIAFVAYIAKRVGQYINQFKSYLDAIANLWRGLSDLVVSILSIPQQLEIWAKAWVNSFVTAWNNMKQAWNSMIDTFQGWGPDSSSDDEAEAMTPEAAAKALISLSDINELSQNVDDIGQATSELVFYLRVAISEVVRNKVPRPILPGDTLESIATEVYGNPSFAEQIASWNNLRYPYITQTGLPGTVRPGDTIYLPYQITGSSGTLATFEPMSTNELLYGRGLKLKTGTELTGDLEISTDGRGLNEVSGIDCVSQGLRVRMSTELGSNRIFPRLGLPVSIGQIVTAAQRSVFNSSVVWQLKNDNRIDNITALVVDDTTEAVKIKPSVTLKTTAQQISVAVG